MGLLPLGHSVVTFARSILSFLMVARACSLSTKPVDWPLRRYGLPAKSDSFRYSLAPTLKDLDQTQPREVFTLALSIEPYHPPRSFASARRRPSCLNSRPQLAVEFGFHSRAEPILRPAQSSVDRPHTKTFTGKLSTNRSRASSLRTSWASPVLLRSTISIRVPPG
jgi:hypothetical protein